MAVKWNTRDSFEEHNERMRIFRESHDQAQEVRTEGYDKLTHAEAMHSFRLTHDNMTTMESGSLKDIASLLTFSPALFPVQRVKLSMN